MVVKTKKYLQSRANLHHIWLCEPLRQGKMDVCSTTAKPLKRFNILRGTNKRIENLRSGLKTYLF